MKPLSPQAQLLLSRYKTTHSLADGESVRLLGEIRERALRGDLPRVDVQPPAPVIPQDGLSQALWASPLGKLGVGLFLLAISGVGLFAWSAGAGEPSRAPQTRLASTAPLREQPTTAPQLAPESPPSIGSEASPEPGPSPAAKAPRAAPAPNAVSTEPTIDEEVRLLNAAQAAVRGNDTRRALKLLGEHASRFPTGKLTSARDVTRMLALCQSGRAEQARSEAARFLAQYPASPFADRVKSICTVPRSQP